ncbi:MAG TPA: hypothetical protein VFS61_07925, partial [Anaerolineales bacterium]|nr:hypothetical protein [Anaerolineales bacterium]
ATNPSPELQRRSTRVKAREYTGPLGILVAGAIGLSLLCSVSAMAMGDLKRYIPITLEPISIVDLAVSNFGTAAALTEQIVTVFVPTETITPSNTPVPASLTPQPTDTQIRFVTITPTATRRPRSTLTPVIIASRTPTRPPPTRAPTITPSRTPTPTTAVPTTEVPTTAVPTTEEPTAVPTTEVPTEPPVTDVPIDPGLPPSGTTEP